MNRRARAADRACQILADALVGLRFHADREFVAWERAHHTP